MGPGLEPIGIPERRQMPPGIEQRLLGGVLGEVRVAQDPARNGVQGVTDAFDQLIERLFVAAHRQLDELSHTLTHYGAGSGTRGQSVSMRELARRAFNQRQRKPAAGSTRGRRSCDRGYGVDAGYGASIWIVVDQGLQIVGGRLVAVLARPHHEAIAFDIEDPHSHCCFRSRDWASRPRASSPT